MRRRWTAYQTKGLNQYTAQNNLAQELTYAIVALNVCHLMREHQPAAIERPIGRSPRQQNRLAEDSRCERTRIRGDTQIDRSRNRELPSYFRDQFPPRIVECIMRCGLQPV